MKRLYFLIALLCCLLLTACYPESKSPLTDENNSQPDKDLIGVWRGKIENDLVYFHFAKGKKNEINGVEIDHQTDSGLKVTAYDIFCTKIGESKYLSVHEVGEKKPAGYLFFKYAISNKKLMFWAIDDKKLAEAIKSGALKGEVKENSVISDVKIDDTTANIINFIKSANDDLFVKIDDFNMLEKIDD
jgi:hypothetical protein